MSASVTVISAIYNIVKAGRTDVFLKNLRSVHAQTHKTIEHLIIDGGSTDGTVKILEKYRKKGWIKYISEPDKGIFDAMNKGARIAGGKYIVFLNSDDYWYDNEGIADSVNALEANQGIFSFAPSITLVDDYPYQTCCTSIGNFFLRMPFCHQTMLTRRDVFLSSGGFDAENYKSAADYHFILRLILAGHKGVFVPRNFTAYSHGGYSAVDMITSANDCVKAMNELYPAIDSSFSQEDARNAFFNHTVSPAFLEKLTALTDPAIARAAAELPQHSDAAGNIVFDIGEYSRPTEFADFSGNSTWTIVLKKIKFFLIPIIEWRETASVSTLKIFGIPLWKVRRAG